MSCSPVSRIGIERPRNSRLSTAVLRPQAMGANAVRNRIGMIERNVRTRLPVDGRVNATAYARAQQPVQVETVAGFGQTVDVQPAGSEFTAAVCHRRRCLVSGSCGRRARACTGTGNGTGAVDSRSAGERAKPADAGSVCGLADH